MCTKLSSGLVQSEAIQSCFLAKKSCHGRESSVRGGSETPGLPPTVRNCSRATEQVLRAGQATRRAATLDLHTLFSGHSRNWRGVEKLALDRRGGFLIPEIATSNFGTVQKICTQKCPGNTGSPAALQHSAATFGWKTLYIDCTLSILPCGSAREAKGAPVSGGAVLPGKRHA